MKNKIIFFLKNIIPYILFIAVWWIIFKMAFIAQNEGVLSIFKDVYGIWIQYLGYAIAIILFFSIFFLQFSIKKRKKVFIIAYCATILFLVMGTVLLKFGEQKFKTFTTEKWIQYPAQRITMYPDLIEKHNIKNYSTVKIETLLGIPDEVANDGTYVYNDRHNNAIYIFFKEGKVYSIHCTE